MDSTVTRKMETILAFRVKPFKLRSSAEDSILSGIILTINFGLLVSIFEADFKVIRINKTSSRDLNQSTSTSRSTLRLNLINSGRRIKHGRPLITENISEESILDAFCDSLGLVDHRVAFVPDMAFAPAVGVVEIVYHES